MFRYFIEKNYSDELDLGWISFKKIKTDDISRIMITVEENKSENPRIIGLEISYPQVFKEGKGGGYRKGRHIYTYCCLYGERPC